MKLSNEKEFIEPTNKYKKCAERIKEIEEELTELEALSIKDYNLLNKEKNKLLSENTYIIMEVSKRDNIIRTLSKNLKEYKYYGFIFGVFIGVLSFAVLNITIAT